MFSFNNLNSKLYFFRFLGSLTLKCFVSLLLNIINVTFSFLNLFPARSSLSLVYMWFGMMLTVDPLSSWNSTSFLFMFITAVILREATSFTCCTDKTNSDDDESSESNVTVYTSCTCFFFSSLLSYMFSQSGLIFHNCKLLQMQGISLLSVHLHGEYWSSYFGLPLYAP